MTRHAKGPSEAHATEEGANDESEGDDDGGDWPPLLELDLKLSILMGRPASSGGRASERRNTL